MNVFQLSSRVQQHRLMAKQNGCAAPLHVGKLLRVDVRAMVRVAMNPSHAGAEEMVHDKCDDGTASDFQ